MEAKFVKVLRLVGSRKYIARTEAEGRMLYPQLRYNHEIEVEVPPAVRVFCLKPRVICCVGLDKQRTHHFAGVIRSCMPPGPYRGEGIRYADELVKLKNGYGKHWFMELDSI